MDDTKLLRALNLNIHAPNARAPCRPLLLSACRAFKVSAHNTPPRFFSSQRTCTRGRLLKRRVFVRFRDKQTATTRDIEMSMTYVLGRRLHRTRDQAQVRYGLLRQPQPIRIHTVPRFISPSVHLPLYTVMF